MGNPRGDSLLARLVAVLRAPTFVHTVNHLGVAVASKIIPVVSIFVYSRLMTVEDYGVLSLFTSYLWIFAIAMSLNLHTGVGRYIYAPEVDFRRFLGTTLMSVGAVYLVTVAAILLGLDRLAELLGLPVAVIALTLLVVLGLVAESLFSQVAIFHQRSALLFRVVALKALLTVGVSLLLLVSMEQARYLAVVYADAAVSVVLFAFVLAHLWPDVQWSFVRGYARDMVQYAVPLIPYMLSLTLLSQFDRVMIDRFHGREETGLYSLAYNIGILLLMAVTAVLNTLNPAFFDALNRKDHARVVRDAQGVYALALLVTGVLVLFGADLAVVVAPARYAGAFDMIPTIAIGGLCFVIFQIWVRVIAYENRTALISAIAVGGTLINIGLNAWLLPIYGFKVAAATTVVAYLAMSIACVWMLNRVIRRFPVDVSRELLYLALLTVVAVILQAFDWPSGWALGFKLACMVSLVWHLKRPLLDLVHARSAGTLA